MISTPWITLKQPQNPTLGTKVADYSWRNTLWRPKAISMSTGHNRDMTDTRSWARKASGTQRTVPKYHRWPEASRGFLNFCSTVQTAIQLYMNDRRSWLSHTNSFIQAVTQQKCHLWRHLVTTTPHGLGTSVCSSWRRCVRKVLICRQMKLQNISRYSKVRLQAPVIKIARLTLYLLKECARIGTQIYTDSFDLTKVDDRLAMLRFTFF